MGRRTLQSTDDLLQSKLKSILNHSISNHVDANKSLKSYTNFVQNLDINDKKTRAIVDDLIKHTLQLSSSPARSRTSILPFLRAENSPYPSEEVYTGDDYPFMEVFETRGEQAHLSHTRSSLSRHPHSRLGRGRPIRTSSTRFEENLDEIDDFISQHNESNNRNIRRRTSEQLFTSNS
ncbi:hypothetical protein E3Q23_02068 [Wallemia mellicola]|uniref:Uncharacterized protein n=1 Tax=Wallemia mellicola TaxID=1708541 RepID=A0A4T0M0B2_9BASI|nr:hypothetical protein E3Q23_02068 [Wallemia mellicola]TIC65343.1 hypothetical protein E3Q01_02196 [Wallemia mellicola]